MQRRQRVDVDMVAPHRKKGVELLGLMVATPAYGNVRAGRGGVCPVRESKIGRAKPSPR
jgi:hypothetical protein